MATRREPVALQGHYRVVIRARGIDVRSGSSTKIIWST
jgi:hypothetical protein